jgi:hypothetical protein
MRSFPIASYYPKSRNPVNRTCERNEIDETRMGSSSPLHLRREDGVERRRREVGITKYPIALREGGKDSAGVPFLLRRAAGVERRREVGVEE